MLKITNLKTNINQDESKFDVLLSTTFKVPSSSFKDIKILKKSIDARKKPVKNVYTLTFSVDQKYENKVSSSENVTYFEDIDYSFNEVNLDKNSKIAIIGYGPAGMFSALNLIENGYKNITVYERGDTLVERNKKINKLFSKAILDTNSNIQFGEGGAGTYSDGKLTSRSKDIKSKYVLETLIKYGAPEDIIYDQHPHVGSDKLQTITKNFSNDLKSKGLVIKFNSLVTDFIIKDFKIDAIEINNSKIINYDYIILAIGHSSRDTIQKLIKSGVETSIKNFAVGLRVEHPQEMINNHMYGEQSSSLGAASYRVTAKTNVNKSVYSFCMCPGGLVVNSSSEENMLCTNGMSNYRRNLANANSAILVNVDSTDFGNEIDSGLKYQRQLESQAFILGGCDYTAPVQNVADFINDRVTENLVTKPSFPNGYKCANLRSLFSDKQITAIIEAVNHFDKIIPDFIDKGVFTGVESRSSSPVRFDRNKEGASLNIKNLYPTGEGAGYAGGIVSSAIDGLRQSENIMRISK